MKKDVATVSIISKNNSGDEMGTKQITPDDHEMTVLTNENGGVILIAKSLIFTWE